MQLSGNFEQILGSAPPGQTSAGPPDQYPGSAPVCSMVKAEVFTRVLVAPAHKTHPNFGGCCGADLLKGAGNCGFFLDFPLWIFGPSAAVSRPSLSWGWTAYPLTWDAPSCPALYRLDCPTHPGFSCARPPPLKISFRAQRTGPTGTLFSFTNMCRMLQV